VKIVTSAKAGYGKSTFIQDHSLKHYKCSKQYHLPLSGVMHVPVNNDEAEN
jgi:hypothetical protein